MGTLTFVCPATGTEVSTGLGMDPHDLESLELSKIYCPRCRQLHQMARILYWLSEFVTSDATRSEDTRAA
jgi:hypothetical protein